MATNINKIVNLRLFDPERSRVECIDDELMRDNSYRIVIQFALKGSEDSYDE